jgi:iron complex outermembrane receptor protein
VLAGAQSISAGDLLPDRTNQVQTTSNSQLKGLSLDQSMNLEATSVTRKPEPWFASPSAIQVIAHDDIERWSVSSLLEALRLAPNLEVAQIDSWQWVISARGQEIPCSIYGKIPWQF